ncbi:MAG: GNAT family N-acetyltransferase [Bacteroidota bacterium]
MGCAGLLTGDLISRGDLYPRLSAFFIEEKHRGNGYPAWLMEKARADAKEAGYGHLYLCTEHIAYYEKYGFQYIGLSYRPRGDEFRIYGSQL